MLANVRCVGQKSTVTTHQVLKFLALLLFGISCLDLAGCAGLVSGKSNTNPGPNPQTLTITNVQANGATDNGFQVSWTTSIAANSAVDYGTTASYGSTTPVNSSLVTSHQMNLSSLAVGTLYHFRVRSTDANGDNAASGDMTFSTLKDTTAPTVSIVSPAAGATLSGTVNLTANASDSVGVSSVQFKVDGTNSGPSLTAAPYTTSLNTTTLSNGNHTLTAVATDTAGNSATSVGVTVKVNNSSSTPPPTVSITSPTSGATVSGTVTVTATATSSVGVANVQFQLDGANVGSAVATSPYTYSWDTTKASNGSHTLNAVATDTTGLSTTSAGVTVKVSNATVQPPTVPTGLAATAVSSSQINLSWSASTDSSGTLAGYKVYRGGSQIGTSTTTSYQDTGLAASTTYTYNVAAYDTAGNTSAQSGSASATTQASSGGGGGGGTGGTGGQWIPGYGQQGWFQYSANTALTSVCPPNNFNGTTYAWATNCLYIYDAWGGAAYDQVGHRMVIFGGGHNNYPGNEVYTMNLGTSSSDPNAGKLIRLTDPTTANQPDGGSPANQNGSQPYGWLADSRGNGVWPNSIHSYFNLTVDGNGNLWFGGGSPENSAGGTNTSMGKFNLASKSWTRIDSGATPGNGNVPGDCGGCLGTYENEPMVFNPNNGHLIIATGSFSTSHLYDYDPTANTSYLVQNNTGETQEYNGMVYDSVDNILYEYGNGDWKYTTPGATPGTWPNWTSLACNSTCSSAIGSMPVGAAFDALNDVIYFFPGSGSTVYKFAPKTNTWTAVVTNTNPCSDDGNSAGVFGRWQFDSTYQVGIYAPNPNGQVCVWWPQASTGGTPSPASITNISPSSGAVGTAVTITGTNFGASQGTSTVTFNGTTAVVNTWSATSITTTVPSGATTGNVVVTVGGQASNGVSFTVSAPSTTPSITSLSPNSGPAGTAVMITGTNFGGSQGSSTVTFNGTAAVVNTWSATSITTTVPSGATTGNVVVTVSGQASNGAAFTVSSSGGGGTTVNGWGSRIAGVNVPGGAASIVSSQSFDTFPVTNSQQYFQLYDPADITTDCTIAADGCSLKFTMLAGFFQGEPGWFDYNFNSTNTALYGEGQEFYVQFKERVDPQMLNPNEFGGGNFTGFKLNIIAEGDSPTVQAGNCSNTPTDFVLISSTDQTFPGMYENCGSTGINLNFLNAGYDFIQLYGPTLPGGGNYLDQPASGCPHYTGQGTPRTDPTCWNFVANEWFTVQEHFKIGTWGSANSTVDVWMAHQGQPSRLIVNAADIAMADQGPSVTDKFGKIVLLPYATASTWNSTTYAWYDDLIISNHRIPDPEVGVPNAPDGLTATVSTGQVTLNWRVNSNNGTAQDDTAILVERCTGTAPECLGAPQSGFSQIAATAAHATTYTDTTVTSGTTYTYRVRTTNAAGDSAYAVAICFNNGTTCSTVTAN
jgi:hypothetical protein